MLSFMVTLPIIESFEWSCTRSGLMQVARILSITAVSFFVLEHVPSTKQTSIAFQSMAHTQQCKQWHLDQWDLSHRAQHKLKYHSSSTCNFWFQHCTRSGSAAGEHPAPTHCWPPTQTDNNVSLMINPYLCVFNNTAASFTNPLYVALCH